MKERNFISSYLRRENTWLAVKLNKISPVVGIDYRRSEFKKELEINIARRISKITNPLARILEKLVQKEDGFDPIYHQRRVVRKKDDFSGEYEEIIVEKIRTMRPGSDAPEVFGHTIETVTHDLRVTKIGSMIRPLELDELPQLQQVAHGELALVEVRGIHRQDFEYMKRVLGEQKFENWERVYNSEGTKLGLFHLDAARRSARFRKANLALGYRYARLYNKKASLGLDLFIIYKCMTTILNPRKRNVVSTVSNSN